MICPFWSIDMWTDWNHVQYCPMWMYLIGVHLKLAIYITVIFLYIWPLFGSLTFMPDWNHVQHWLMWMKQYLGIVCIMIWRKWSKIYGIYLRAREISTNINCYILLSFILLYFLEKRWDSLTCTGTTCRNREGATPNIWSWNLYHG
jgi:hypothetical protein